MATVKQLLGQKGLSFDEVQDDSKMEMPLAVNMEKEVEKLRLQVEIASRGFIAQDDGQALSE
jgi:hypothetical protein